MSDEMSHTSGDFTEQATECWRLRGGLICKDCQRVISLNDDCLVLREGAAVKTLGFQSSGMSLRIEAHCENLRQSGVCEHCRRDGGEHLSE